jgi:hypothetical protein
MVESETVIHPLSMREAAIEEVVVDTLKEPEIF